MRSHLTPQIFRRLLSPQGLTFRCHSRTYSTIPIRFRPHTRNGYLCILRPQTRRTMFGFSKKTPRQPKDPELDPGLSKMLDLNLMEKIQARPPPPGDLVKAWKAFFAYKREKGYSVNNIQAKHVHKTFLHLLKLGFGDENENLNEEDLKIARQVLLAVPKDEVVWHNRLARELYDEFESRAKQTGGMGSHMNVRNLVEVLSLTGDAVEARALTINFWDSATNAPQGIWRNSQLHNGSRLWRSVIAGFAKDGNEVEMLRTWEMAEKVGVRYGSRTQQIMTSFFAERNNVEATKMWFEKYTGNKGPHPQVVEPETVTSVLRFCMRNDELEWCKSVFRDILAQSPSKSIWDVVLQWAAGAMGKGVEDVERMMSVMAEKSTETQPTAPDVDTINGLVDFAMSLKDPYLAERYIALGLKWDIRPNAHTYILQMNYRVDAGDLTGAKVAYDALQAEEIIDNEDLPAINKYIRALCSGKGNNHDRVVSIYCDLEERKVRLEAETVLALSMVYLNRNELDELVDMLQSNVYHYTLDERALIRDGFLTFCLNRNNSTTRVWDAYTIMRQIFDETSTEIRTKMMNVFFERKRCDMACHTFGHMRQHINKERRPVLDTYISCFEGIARCEDRESLDMVHNMLKMDSSIEPATKLYNSLMLAYTACEDADRALDFWDDITNSSEGPSYKSLEIVFWCCGRKPFGDGLAREIWSKMRRMEIEVTREVFRSFVGALSGQGKLQEAKALVEGMEGEFGFKVDWLTLGTVYNALPGQNRKDLGEEWAKELYAEQWKELVKVGWKKQKEGHKLFKITREMKA